MASKSEGPLVVGVDVGGTNTDSVLLDLSRAGTSAVLSSHKSPTTTDVTEGVEATLTTLLSKSIASGEDAGSPPDPTSISALAIGTTHFLNAIIQRDASLLSKVAVIRLGSHGFVKGALPFADWPRSLRGIIEGYSAIVPGGVNIDGRLIAPLNEKDLRLEARKIHELKLQNVVVVGMGSPMDTTYHQESEAGTIILSELEKLDTDYAKSTNIVLSHSVAGSGLLARENASVLNAAILTFARRTVYSFMRAMRKVGLQCPLYLTSNAGHLLPFSEAVSFPIRIFSSGATNSMRGAAFLAREELATISGDKGCVVVDVGGTTSDVGALLPNGYPRLSKTYTELAGVKINLDMPSVESIGLGGGSIIREVRTATSSVTITVGPDSVGHDLTSEAMCFGGSVPTATDVAIASSPNELLIGDPALVKLDSTVVACAADRIKNILEALIDRIKLSPEDCTVVLVGGGAILCPPTLKGVNHIIRSEHAGVANAIGAALAKIYGTAEVMVDADDLTAGIARVMDMAVANATAKGGVSREVTVLNEEVEWVPYVDNKKLVRIEVACSADHTRVYAEMVQSPIKDDVLLDSMADGPSPKGKKASTTDDTYEGLDLATYRPKITPQGEWIVSPIDLKFIEIGCYVLGCGGGGSPYASYLHLMELLREGERIIITRIEDLLDDAVLPPVAAIGTPAVGQERIASDAVFHALQRLSKEQGNVEFTHLLATEIGGRAYPNFEMVSQYVNSESVNELLPVVICSGDGQDAIVPAGQADETAAGKEIRKVCANFGFAAGAAGTPLSGARMRRDGIPNTFSLAWRLGRVVRRAQVESRMGTITDALVAEAGGARSARRVFTGKIRGVETRITETGHSLGEVVIEGLGEDEVESEAERAREGEGWKEVRVPFMNENLAVLAKGTDGAQTMLATVPDLIMVLDVSTGEAIGVQEYRYGVKVVVMLMAPHPIWASKRGLEVAGPKAFNLPYEYTSDLEYAKPASVIDEFRHK
ncbi:hydantoinase [Verticillium alfalfae VaMs.102]|uniref:Hydantoinase n=1 Tax=Verticillium alfalfae (strain VaMs.102 / ATCC MYA-4576 / FGSC 10136) TaxID=526221 RepID=C9SEJ9_VERA1|nr:hydantoinase [Verticillium alfalfae VaMs.102]EEY16592.1 hydantoinase [Verticillium alfalfae VaMs.102]